MKNRVFTTDLQRAKIYLDLESLGSLLFNGFEDFVKRYLVQDANDLN